MNNSTNKQFFLRALLTIQTLFLVIYTIYTFKYEGCTLFQVFANNISTFNWNGQFNLDFSTYLTLSALWIMWRNKFSMSAVAVALMAMVIGIMFFAPYLLYLLTIEKGDLKRVLVGDR